MKNTATKALRALCGMVVMLALMAGITSVPVLAASNGIYTATATSHYRHPTTGVIEDSGGEGSAVLGQSMTDSALNKSALVEVDANGSTWVTIRLNLMDNIQSPKFQVDGSSVSATLMQEDYSNNTADYRMKVNSENSIIRCNMYVVPMGREVIFYITVGNLKSGSGDFITSITVEEPEPTPKPTPEPTQTPSSSSQSTESENSAQNSSETPDSSAESSDDPESSESEESSEPSGLVEFDESGNEVSVTSVESESESNGSGSAVLWWVIGGIVVIAAAGGSVWYFCFVRKGKNPFKKK